MTLGPHWAFETGNLGRLTRRVPASQVVCAVPLFRRKPKPHGLSRNPTPPQNPRASSAARFLRFAQGWQRQLDAGEIESQAAIARRKGLTRARVCQIMSLLRLAPEIQGRILSLPKSVAQPCLSERGLRSTARIESPRKQAVALKRMVGHFAVSP